MITLLRRHLPTARFAVENGALMSLMFGMKADGALSLVIHLRQAAGGSGERTASDAAWHNSATLCATQTRPAHDNGKRS